MPTTEGLQDTLTYLREFRSILPRIRTEALPRAGFVEDALDLALPTTASSRLRLADMGFEGPVRDLLQSALENGLSRFQKAAVQKIQESLQALSVCTGVDETYRSRFRARLEKQYYESSHNFQIELLNTILCRHNQEQQNDDGKSSSYRLPRNDQISAKRGHHISALRILERAYAHTPNITQAEKYKLAEATGLQPRQVTIWFQNQRNRKTKKAVKTEDEPEEIIPAELAAPAKRKPVYGHYLGVGSVDVSDGESATSSCASKKRRTGRIASDESYGTIDSGISFDSLNSNDAWSGASSSSSSVSDEIFANKDDANALGNVFHHLSLPQVGNGFEQPMPAVTIDNKHFQDSCLPGAFRDTAAVCYGEAAHNDFANLQLDEEAIDCALQQGLDHAFTIHSATTPVRQTVSSANFMTPVNDEDEWMDEDDFVRAPRKVQPRYGALDRAYDDTPTHSRAHVQLDQMPHETHDGLQAAAKYSTTPPQSSLSQADTEFIDSLWTLPNSSPVVPSDFQVGTSADGQACLDLEIDMAELDLFFQQVNQPQNQHQQMGGQYMFNFDGASSDVFLPISHKQ